LEKINASTRVDALFRVCNGVSTLVNYLIQTFDMLFPASGQPSNLFYNLLLCPVIALPAAQPGVGVVNPSD
jgi:hypothetical protein